MSDECVMCSRSPDDLGHGCVLLTRPRPSPARGEYQICGECARRVKREQDKRAQGAIKEAERSGV